MTDEEQRRKMFVKAHGEIIKVWPGYAAHHFPAPTNRTDQCLLCDLKFSLEFLIKTWRDCRAGKATMREFEVELVRWKIIRLHVFELFDLGRLAPEDSVAGRKKKAIQAARETSKFRG